MTSSEPPRRALLLANPAARRVRQRLPRAIRYLEGRGILPVLHDLHTPGLRDAPAKLTPPPDLVIVAGGDGTLNSVADVLVEWQLPLGILPLGTANDLARTLGIPTELEEACRVVVEGHQRQIDLGQVNGKYFFNVASLGLSVSITRRLSGDIKRRWGVLGYLWTALRATWRARPFHAEIRLGERLWRVKTLQIAVGNGRFYGGGMAVAEHAVIDDQQLDLYSLEVEHWWELLRLFPALRRGSFAECPQVRTLHGQHFEIRTRKPRRINCDGELVTGTPAVFQVVPRCLRVFTPGP